MFENTKEAVVKICIVSVYILNNCSMKAFFRFSCQESIGRLLDKMSSSSRLAALHLELEAETAKLLSWEAGSQVSAEARLI